MKDDKNSLTLLKKHMLLESMFRIILSVIAILLLVIQVKSIEIKIFLFVIVIGANVAGVMFYWDNIYKSGRQLYELAEKYWENSGLALDEHAVDTENVVKRISAIVSSLDTMAIQQKNAEILMKNAEIHNLQDQINPHFLYNTLEMIRGEAMENGDRKVAEMIASLANYFRYNISRKESFVYLKDELKNSINYFNIQKNRFRDKISYEILYYDIEESEVGNCYIPKLILQPIIENAIYHGLELKLGKGKIKVYITAVDWNLKIVVADDGLGMSLEKVDILNSDVEENEELPNQKHNGVAIRNIKKRLKLYWGERAYLFAVSQSGVGTQFHLSMPLLYEKEAYMN